jgi:hypothetical protein
MKIIKPKVSPGIWKRNSGKDIVLNVTFKDALIRFGFTILIPIIALFINAHLVIYTAPVIAYLFISVLIRFCVIKQLWHYYIMNERTPVLTAYGKDPNYPEETV